MKKHVNLISIIGLIAVIGFGLTACSSSSSEDEAETEQSNKQSTEANEKAKEQATLAKINSAIAKDLKLDQGWAEGSLDEDGNPTEDGTPNDDFAWSIVVDKIICEGDTLRVYVKRGFKQLDNEDRQIVIESAMRASYSDINKYKKLDQEEDIKKGIFTEIYLDSTPIGRSKLSNHYEFNWDE
ncbi:hypothetical protein [Lactobacillus johnsonii]|uniref:hypothetical protein n=1 Tax=Lactobacillus johnsonii TaxID=33959 RepID=UPI00107E650E|nr:hypothetical protein [Lactobacillus johnsonii]TGA95006.1 hypothetical protein E5F86_02655 [Lactobacillus johnsonii]